MKNNLLKRIYSRLYTKIFKIKYSVFNNKDLCSLITKNDIISFDIFDTAILRKVYSPSDIFYLTEKVYTEKHGALSFNFKDVRTKAEQQAAKLISKQNYTESICLDEIYDYIHESLNISKRELNILKSIEMQTELEFCTRNEYIFSYYQQCIAQNKKVIFTSDMYLPKDIIKRILLNNGYEKYENIYLSGEIRKSKYKGGLYKYILKELKCKSKKILHIGANFKEDIINAQHYNINIFYYKKVSDYALKNTHFKRLRELYNKNLSIEESLYFATITNKAYSKRNTKKADFWYDFGYIYCGIIYFGFIRWLTAQLANNEPDKVLFLARDGYIMHQTYKLLNSDSSAPLSEYMYASRRAINIPTIRNKIDESSIKILCHTFPNLSVKNYLERVDLCASNYTKEIHQVGFNDKDQIILNNDDKQKLALLFNLLVADVTKVSVIERRYLIKYLEQIKFIGAKKVAIVDIGWQGTIQNSLSELMNIANEKVEIDGYYIGTFQTAAKFIDKGMNMSGYMCNLSTPKNNFNILAESVHMFEFIFSAPHGSVIKFREEGDKIVPVCEPNKSSDQKIIIINNFQKGALDFISDFKEVEKAFKEIHINPEFAIKPISRLLNNPTYNESIHFGDLKHSEYVGDNSYENCFAKASSPWKMYFNPLKFRRKYSSSLWKAGFRKRYLRYVLPDSLYCFLKHR
ncbi:hypothetical protein NQT65_03185 [Pseudoalteromonas agarivorans]|uniref:HAD family hydrolase n=1 Tax=Pseudoalteromonas agarivorans TaxID=176102 RepID=UPI0021190192|nr:hypothetical protein [Pseudoalteromonas agarivorans]MCQ8819214.1 hypothetical protein [Pseudoalteromonas agarivorans]